MLNRGSTLRLCSLALAISIAWGCATKPGPGVPNVRDKLVQDEVLMVTNGMQRSLAILPPKDSSTLSTVTLRPSESATFKFTLSKEHNVGDAGDKQIVMVPERSSPYLRQSVNDLLLSVRVDQDRAKEVRITVGDCLFETAPPAGGFSVRLTRMPLPGIPVRDLCAP